MSGWNCEVRTGFLPKVELKLMENMKIPSDYTNDHMFSTNASHLDYEWDSASPPVGLPVLSSASLQLQSPALQVRSGQRGPHC